MDYDRAFPISKKTRDAGLRNLRSSISVAENECNSAGYFEREHLKLLGVGVIFEKEGINTMSLGDEMLLNTFTAIAQEESKAISQNQRISIVKRMELGIYVDSNAPYGFHLENKQLVEYSPEADIVRWIFQAYLRGMSTAEIAKDLTDRGIPTKNGKEKWKSSKISYMLSNERYIGDCCYQKTYRGTTVPFKQSKNRGEEDMYYATGTHAPIVEKDLFDKVQVLLKKRKEQFTKATTQNIYPLTSRIRCSECGSFYRRKVRSGGVKWVCAKHEEDFKACNSNYYSEERIYDGFLSMVSKLRFGQENILGQVIAKLEYATQQYKRNNKTAMQISQKIAEINATILKLNELRSKGYSTSSNIYALQFLGDEAFQFIKPSYSEFVSGLEKLPLQAKHPVSFALPLKLVNRLLLGIELSAKRTCPGLRDRTNPLSGGHKRLHTFPVRFLGFHG